MNRKGGCYGSDRVEIVDLRPPCEAVSRSDRPSRPEPIGTWIRRGTRRGDCVLGLFLW